MSVPYRETIAGVAVDGQRQLLYRDRVAATQELHEQPQEVRVRVRERRDVAALRAFGPIEHAALDVQPINGDASALAALCLGCCADRPCGATAADPTTELAVVSRVARTRRSC
jgi:hypothetical protein